MELEIFETKEEMAESAAKKSAEILKKTIAFKGHANFIAATGKSQIEFLENLIKDVSIEWPKITMFHLDEYIGLPETHKASFCRYLRKRLVDKVHPGAVHFINGNAKNPEEECKRLNKLIANIDIDVAFVGIGVNGHLAFNDPPADFNTNKSFIIVKLNKANRMQQVKDAWFSRLSEVPKQAISISIKQIMKSKNIVCLAPDKRKAKIVKDCFEKEISPMRPASILRKHPRAFIYLDKNSASLLNKSLIENNLA